jgi:hypothetical protein
MHWGVFAISAAHLYQNYLEDNAMITLKTSGKE